MEGLGVENYQFASPMLFFDMLCSCLTRSKT